MARVELRCTDSEKALWVLEAGRQGLGLSEWIRQRCGSPGPAEQGSGSVDGDGGVVPVADGLRAVLARRFG